ncbi:uncharacterized protein LOC135391336 [Ornithodoros turicata]|uniref:uncharacterized protein LOC135391336 n=1 Tax=Ornithodoros turicata TaxID=34597 RepID=UPI003139FF1B
MERMLPDEVDDSKVSSSGNSNCSTRPCSSPITDASRTTDVYVVQSNENFTEKVRENTPENLPLAFEKPTPFSRIYHYVYLARLEIFFFAYIFSRFMVSTPIGDLLLHKACLNSLQYNASICEQLDRYPDVKDAAEKIGSNCGMFRVIISFAPSAVIAIFIGPWCDKYGYKTPLLISNAGCIISTTLVLATAYMMALPLYYDVLAAIPDGLSGGFIAVFMAVYSEATVTTKGGQRRTKFFLLSLCFSAAFPLGGLIGGQIYGRFGICVVLRASICLLVICQLWVTFVLTVPESVKLLNHSSWTKLRSFFKLENLVDGFRTCVRDRPGTGKAQLWLIFAAQSLMIVDMTASTVAYYFVRKMYSWSVAYYTTVSAVSSGVTYAFYFPTMFLFTRVLHVSDLWMAAVGTFFAVAQFVICGLAYKDWLYYVQFAVGIPTFLGSVGIRTHLSKIVEGHEIGKVFSFFACFESILPIAGEVVFTKIFQWSLDFFPGMVYLTAAALSFCAVLLLGYCIHISSHSYAPMDEENESICEDNCNINT